MGLAIALITVGGIFAYSGIKGLSIAEVLAGATGNTLNPKGGTTASDVMPPRTTEDPSSSQNKWGFQGPNATLLASLANAAESSFNLKITSVASGTHVTNSMHYAHRAFDAAGAPADMAAYAKYAHDQYGHTLAELYYDPTGVNVNDGKDTPGVQGGHSDHVHTGA